MTFETPANYCPESAIFDVAEVSLPFIAILGSPALYQFVAISHYGYLVLKMPSPNGERRPKRLLLATSSRTKHC
jgi:hypothetical protein